MPLRRSLCTFGISPLTCSRYAHGSVKTETREDSFSQVAPSSKTIGRTRMKFALFARIIILFLLFFFVEIPKFSVFIHRLVAWLICSRRAIVFTHFVPRASLIPVRCDKRPLSTFPHFSSLPLSSLPLLLLLLFLLLLYFLHHHQSRDGILLTWVARTLWRRLKYRFYCFPGVSRARARTLTYDLYGRYSPRARPSL